MPTHADPTRAVVAGREMPLASALDEAAGLIQAARTPLFLLSCDTAATLAALDLAEICGAVVDVGPSEALAVEIGALQGRGGFLISRREALARADVILLAGEAAERLGQDHWERVRLPQRERTVLKLSAVAGEHCGAVTSQLAALTALLKGEAPVLAERRFDPYRPFADALLGAKFGVVAWSPSEIDTLDVAALMNLVGVLNERTRFSSLPLRSSGNAWGINQLMLARWGVAARARFAGGIATYDPWLFSGPRMIRDGEADAVLVVSGFGEADPLAPGNAPLIAIGAAHAGARVSIASGIAGVDHDGAWYDETTDALMAHRAAKPSTRPGAAAILHDLAGRLRGSAR